VSDLKDLQAGDKVWVKGCRDSMLAGEAVRKNQLGWTVNISGHEFSVRLHEIIAFEKGLPKDG